MVPFAPMESVEDCVPEEYDQQYQQLELQELAESQLMKERRIRFANSKRKIDPSQLITPPGTKVRLHLEEEDNSSEVCMLYPGVRPPLRNRPDLHNVISQMVHLGEEGESSKQLQLTLPLYHNSSRKHVTAS